jgi:hypothetical protein
VEKSREIEKESRSWFGSNLVFENSDPEYRVRVRVDARSSAHNGFIIIIITKRAGMHLLVY